MHSYIPILILLLLAIALGLALIGLGALITRTLIRPSRAPRKYDIYESGVNPIHDARLRFSIKFYLIAMLFIIFDVEVVFFLSLGGRLPGDGAREPADLLGDGHLCWHAGAGAGLSLAERRAGLGVSFLRPETLLEGGCTDEQRERRTG
ncbi:MAG: hypothetical protein KatS3mg115_0216 [Candidatus Poribacteria bacterium]|nr:MAG: hypothetical protein KatS3mg115_0216 [Candidatus Poribacteria bacterium]